MSGGVGPSGDIRLPKEDQEQSSSTATATTNRHQIPPSTARRRGFLSFPNLNALAVTVVFSASGLVAPEDFTFVLFSLLYMYFISKVAFPCVGQSPEEPVFDRKNKLLRLYILAGAVTGIFLPIAYIFEGIFEGDKEGIKAAAPHVFLLASQVFAEGLVASGRFSIPVRVFVPVFFNSRRIFTIVEWLRTEIGKAEEEYGGSARRLYVGRALAVANMAFWSFNLFGFLLPVYLPRAFKKYYYSGYTNDKHKD